MSRKRSFLSLIFVALIAVGAFYYFRDTTPPTLSLSPSTGAVNHRSTLDLSINDKGMGLKSVSVIVRSGDRTHPLLKKTWPTQKSELKLQIVPAKFKPAQGAFDIEVTATDQSIYHLGKGNKVSQTFQLTYDSRPPGVSVLSKTHNLSHGGSGLVVYTVGEEPVRTGMQVGSRFFPAYQQDKGVWACLFAFPLDDDPDQVIPQLIAEDRAGNIGKGSFYYRVKTINYPQIPIELTPNFLNAVDQEFAADFPAVTDPVERFLKVNRQLRKKNRAQLATLMEKTSPTPLFSGSFLRQPGSRTGGFGNKRSYFYDGKNIDRQTHLGIDIASIASAEVKAANRGTVVWAGPMGIYGQCVIIDHGLGLQTLYGHLSRIDVTEGEPVNRGDIIARTGATGIAAGDHLHFGVTVGGIPVRPVEWWDPNWVKSHIEDKLALEP